MFYEDIHDEDRVGEKFPMPVGQCEFSEDEEEDDNRKQVDDKIPNTCFTKYPVHFCFENKNSCAFGNMANAAYELKDKITGTFFYVNRHKDPNEMRNKFTKIDQDYNINEFHIAREILRQRFKYKVKRIKGDNLIEIAKEYENEVLYVMLEISGRPIAHAICISNNRIVDGTFSHKLKCNRESLHWLCDKTSYTFLVYLIKAKAKLKET